MVDVWQTTDTRSDLPGRTVGIDRLFTSRRRWMALAAETDLARGSARHHADAWLSRAVSATDGDRVEKVYLLQNSLNWRILSSPPTSTRRGCSTRTSAWPRRSVCSTPSSISDCSSSSTSSPNGSPGTDCGDEHSDLRRLRRDPVTIGKKSAIRSATELFGRHHGHVGHHSAAGADADRLHRGQLVLESPRRELRAGSFWPVDFSLVAYQEVLTNPQVLQGYYNSLIYASPGR